MAGRVRNCSPVVVRANNVQTSARMVLLLVTRSPENHSVESIGYRLSLASAMPLIGFDSR